MSRRIFRIIIALCAPLLAACDVHQFPIDESIFTPGLNVTLHLKFDTDMKLWEHTYNVTTGELTQISPEELPTYDNAQTGGEIRHTVRVYPFSEYNSSLGSHLYEYTFYEDLSESGYDYETTISVPQGEYTIMVWSDIVPASGELYFHDVSEFAQALLLDHRINTDYRDAFRGTTALHAGERVVAYSPTDDIEVDVVVEMHRPMAKFEIIAEGIDMFIQQEAARNMSPLNFSDYTVAIAYTGFTPNAYNILTDGIVDSKYREMFLSSPVILDGSSASLGFDYAIVRNSETSASVQIAIYDPAGEEIASSDPIQIPLRRDHHTVVRGRFLEAHSSGGSIGIDPSYEGEFNIFR